MSQARLIETLLAECLRADQERLGRRLQALEKTVDYDVAEWQKLVDDVNTARERRRARAQHGLRLTYDPILPISQSHDEIAKLIRENQVIVLCGATGSGKTTQLPKICLELGRGVEATIGHTQPRRIAARSLATRISEETGAQGTNKIGYKVRFGDKTDSGTLVKVMTDGILLAETQSDPELRAYDTLIIDEAHERSLNVDFLLGYIKRLLPRRPDLKLIITSATIDTERFSQHFGNCPIIEVSGRTYPVEVRYQPLEVADLDEDVSGPQTILDPLDGIVNAVRGLLDEGHGDVLVFLSTEREIHEAATALSRAFIDWRGGGSSGGVDVLPLFARLPVEQQQRVFSTSGGSRPRVVLATNVAETSLTVPNIRSVVDPGTARISRYSPKTKVQRLPIEKVSQASAEQRKGRCGRVAPGVCVRLYSEADFAERPAFTEPEIRRTNLAAVILQMTALRLGDVVDFPFLDPPDVRQIRDGYTTLVELGAVTNEHALTDTGRKMARIPADPRISRMVLQALEEDVLDEVLVIAAGLSVQDPRDRPQEMAQAADQAHAVFRDNSSDFMTYLKMWEVFAERSRALGSSKLRKWCRDHFLSYSRMREWQEVHRQLRAVAADTLVDRRRHHPHVPGEAHPESGRPKRPKRQPLRQPQGPAKARAEQQRRPERARQENRRPPGGPGQLPQPTQAATPPRVPIAERLAAAQAAIEAPPVAAAEGDEAAHRSRRGRGGRRGRGRGEEAGAGEVAASEASTTEPTGDAQTSGEVPS